MNNLEKNNLMHACKSARNIAINISEFCDLLSDDRMLDPVTDKDILSTGLFATLYGAKCFVNSNIPPGFISISNKEDLSSYKDSNWMNPIRLDNINFKKYIKLKVFW